MNEPAEGSTSVKETVIEVRGLEMAYGSFVLMRDLNFTIGRGDIFIIMGGSGCGKSTLLKHLVGLKKPARGQILYNGVSFWEAEPEEQERLKRRFGILFQSGALWSSMTLAENIAMPLEQYTSLPPGQIRELVSLQAGAGRARRLRGVLSLGDQRRHEETGRPRPGHGPRPGHSLF